ncbi:hypothetical protein TNCV_4501171 [Trichonephila clavipes]|nr:hypothetical protein TNCV_4501171 [Trichonephila clavipes]
MCGKFKIVPENDNEKVEELTYEFFSRHFGAGERGQAIEEIPKPPPPKEPKLPHPNELPSKPVIPKADTISSIFGSKKRKLKRKKMVKRRKKSKKNKIKKRKTFKKKLGGTSGKKSTPKPKMPSKVKLTKKRNTNTIKYKRQKTDSGKTLVQMLKASERVISKGKIVKKEKLSDN